MGRRPDEQGLEAELLHAFGNIWRDLKEDVAADTENAVLEHLVPTARKFDAVLARASVPPNAKNTAAATE